LAESELLPGTEPVTATVASDLGETAGVVDLNDIGGDDNFDVAACVEDFNGATGVVDLDAAGAAVLDAAPVLGAAGCDLLTIGTRTERMNERGFQTGV
jgi:hypothetical protein